LQISDQEFGDQRAINKLENLETGFDIGISTMKIKPWYFKGTRI
jgi:hypothetical protein